MIELFQGGSGSSYVMSAADTNSKLFDFSDDTFKVSPTTQYAMVPLFANFVNVFKVDSTDILAANSGEVYVFVHTSGGSIGLPSAIYEYTNVNIDFLRGPSGIPGPQGTGTSDDYDATIRTDSAGNSSPQQQQRAGYEWAGRIIFA